MCVYNVGCLHLWVLLVGGGVRGLVEETCDVEVRRGHVNISVAPDVVAHADVDMCCPFHDVCLLVAVLTSEVNRGIGYPQARLPR